MVPADFPRYAGRHADHAWPSIGPVGRGHRHIMIRGSVFRTVSEASWDAARRIADMRAAGIAVQALSPVPGLLSYWFEADDAVVMADRGGQRLHRRHGERPAGPLRRAWHGAASGAGSRRGGSAIPHARWPVPGHRDRHRRERGLPSATRGSRRCSTSFNVGHHFLAYRLNEWRVFELGGICRYEMPHAADTR